jgi:uncharacterized protein (TIGR02246 family)
MFRETANSGEVDALVALFEPGATLASRPGEIVTGTKAIRGALTGFFAANPKFTKLETTKVFQTGDVALLYSDWELTGPDGNEINMTGRGMEVVRRQPDGTWLFVIDNPWGVDEL